MNKCRDLDFERKHEEDLQRLRGFRLLDDDFMSKVFEDIKCAEFLLQIILNRDDLKVKKSNSQYSVKNLQGKSVRLDILAVDRENRVYNIEIQRNDKGAGVKRARVYLYSYATNEREALSEAEHVLRLVKDYQMAYPVYYDLEDNNTTGRQSNQTIANIAQTFAQRLEQEGYYVGMYASLFWFRTKLTSPIFNEYTKWIARYNDELNYDGEYGMWQYSATGNVLGIDTMVDLNYAYKDFPQIIEEGGYNNFSNTNLTRYKIGDEVEFHHVFLTSESTQPLMPYRHFGIITRIVQGARNPYLIGQDAGWVNDQVIERKIRYLSAPDYTGNSFTDALRSIQEDASFANRTKLAKLNGIDNYTGSQRQNDELLRLLKEGKLRT